MSVKEKVPSWSLVWVQITEKREADCIQTFLITQAKYNLLPKRSIEMNSPWDLGGILWLSSRIRMVCQDYAQMTYKETLRSASKRSFPYPFKYNNPLTFNWSKGIVVCYSSWWFMAYSSCQARKALALSSLIGRVSIHSSHASVSSGCVSTNSTNVILPSC